MEGVRQTAAVRNVLFITILASCLLIIFSAVAVIGFMRTRMKAIDVAIANTSIRAKVAATSASQKQGLSGTAALKASEGMLFVYDEPAAHEMWMKDMQYPLDILWLDDEKRVVHIVQRLGPETYPNSYGSPVPAKYVLEVPAGFVEAHHVKTGTIAAFSREAVY